MRNSIFWTLASLALLISTSCDKIEGPYLEQNTELAVCDTPTFPPLSNPIQKLILEEFTGHTCVNCPQGHKKAADLKTRFEDTIVLMAIHAGSFAEPQPNTIYTADYRTEAGDLLNSTFGVQGYPSGMVNRTAFMGSLVMDKSAWASAANAIDRTAPSMAIQLEIVDHPADEGICVFAKATYLQNTQKNIKLALFLLEDSIVSPQTNNTASLGAVPDISDYVHRHMLRAPINSVWGDQIGSANAMAVANSTVVKGYGFSFKNKPYIKSHCVVVAIAYDVDSKAVVQVEEVELD